MRRRTALPFALALAPVLAGGLAPAPAPALAQATGPDQTQGQGQGQEQGPAIACPSREPRIAVSLQDPAPSLSRDSTVAALHDLSGQPQQSGLHHLGITVLRTEWRSEIALRVATGPAGVCAVVEGILLTLANAEHRILIAREIPAGGCLYEEVEAHERRHVAVNRRTLREAAAPLRQAVEAWAATAEARAPSAEAARAMLQEGLRQAMEPAMAALAEKRAAANRQVDAPEEYRRLSQSCALDQVRLQDRLRNP